MSAPSHKQLAWRLGGSVCTDPSPVALRPRLSDDMRGDGDGAGIRSHCWTLSDFLQAQRTDQIPSNKNKKCVKNRPYEILAETDEVVDNGTGTLPDYLVNRVMTKMRGHTRTEIDKSQDTSVHQTIDLIKSIVC